MADEATPVAKPAKKVHWGMTVLGALAGLGVVVLLQQYGKAHLTTTNLILGIVVGAGLGLLLGVVAAANRAKKGANA